MLYSPELRQKGSPYRAFATRPSTFSTFTMYSNLIDSDPKALNANIKTEQGVTPPRKAE